MEIGKFKESLSSQEVHRVVDPLVLSAVGMAKRIRHNVLYKIAEFDVNSFGSTQLMPWEIKILNEGESPLSEMASKVDADRTLPTELL